MKQELLAFLQQIQPFLAPVAAVASLATLGFILRLAGLIKSNERARADVIEEHLKFEKAQKDEANARADRISKDLTTENDRLRSELSNRLSEAGFSLDAFVTGTAIDELKQAVAENISDLVQRMEERSGHLNDEKPPQWYLELAKAHMVQSDWLQAADNFDEYLLHNPSDFDVQFARGVALANSRQGTKTELRAYRSYCEAVAFVPNNIDENLKSRLFTYRGAMLKRLNRPSDALPDIEYGFSLAKQDREKGDALYNLACVFAQLGETTRLYDTMRLMKGYPQFLTYALADAEGYFANYSHDEKFLAKDF